MRNLIHDVRHGLRVLVKSPGLTAIAVLALGLGVGVNTTVFSLADVLLYRPLPVPDLDRFVTVSATRMGSGGAEDVSLPDLLDWRAGTRTVESLAAVTRTTIALTGSGEPIWLEAARVSPEFFQALATQPELGRTFLANEQEKGSGQVAVLAHSLWENRYWKSPDVLGRTVKLDGADYQIVGVMPKDLEYPNGVQLWIPAAFSARDESAHAVFAYGLVGRLKPGASLDRANPEFRLLARRSERKYPDSHANRGARVELVRKTLMGQEVEPFMRMLTGAVLFVLLIACADVASLQFARLSGRTREIAIRSAVGAGRARLMAQFLTESVVLASIGAVAGVLFGDWGAHVLRTNLPADVARYVPGWQRLGVDWHALSYALAVSAAAGIVSGVAPAWFASKTNLIDTLKEGGRGTSGTRSRQRIRSVLVVAEMVLTMVLPIGAGLMVSGTRRLAEPAPDLHPESALTLRINLPESRYPKPAQRVRVQEDLLDSLASLPGARSAGFGAWLPYAVWEGATAFTVPEQPAPKPGAEPAAMMQVTGGAYFQNLHIGLVRGRLFDQRDGDGAPPAAVISEHLARRYFAGEGPLGKHVRPGPLHAPGEAATVVGVVADVRLDPWDHDIKPVIYRPFRQAPGLAAHFILRTTGDPRALIAAARDKVARIDPNQPVRSVGSYAKVIDDRMVGLRYVASMMAVFGVIGLLLSAAGIYGVMAYSVSERTREIGLRMALGASPAGVIWMLGRWGLLLTGTGLCIGVSAALLLASLLKSLLYGVGTYDPGSFGAGVLVLCSAAMLACYIPVRRALAVDPIIALRAE